MTFNDDHLTESEFSDCVIERSLSPAREAHVASCAQCQKELSAFGSSVSNFAAASMAFSCSLPARAILTTAPRSLWSLTFAPAAWAATAALVIAGSLPVWHLIHPVENAIVINDSASQIALDNQLMQSVDVALAASDASPLDEFHVTATPDVHGRLALRHRP